MLDLRLYCNDKAFRAYTIAICPRSEFFAKARQWVLVLDGRSWPKHQEVRVETGGSLRSELSNSSNIMNLVDLLVLSVKER